MIKTLKNIIPNIFIEIYVKLNQIKISKLRTLSPQKTGTFSYTLSL
jgi:hypothetical protein